jgi:hypothetical protein
MRRRQQAHDLRATGLTLNAIQDHLAPIGRTTISEWLRQPRPTDEEVAAFEHDYDNPQTDHTNQVPIKMRLSPRIYLELQHEADTQGASMSKLANCAVELYLDCISRLREGRTDPVNLRGYLRGARFPAQPPS